MKQLGVSIQCFKLLALLYGSHFSLMPGSGAKTLRNHGIILSSSPVGTDRTIWAVSSNVLEDVQCPMVAIVDRRMTFLIIITVLVRSTRFGSLA